MAIEFPQRLVPAVQQLAARLHDSRKPNTPLERLGHDMLVGFYDICVFAGLDGVLEQLAAELEIESTADRAALADSPRAAAAVVQRLQAINLDGGGPRNAKPREVADCVIAGLGLTLVEEPDRNIALGDDVRTAIKAAIGGVLDEELAIPKFREAIVGAARARLDEAHQAAFTKVAAQLDDRGLTLTKVPKVPIDALHASQTAIAEARAAQIGRITGIALDRVRDVLARTAPEAAARIDQPVFGRATLREVAIRRACDPRVTKTATHLVPNMVDSITELVPISWRATERAAQPYGASKTFSVGDVIEHPKFGRGTVMSAALNKIDVEFADTKVTLIHVPAKK